MNILDRFRKKSNPKNYSNWENERYISLLDQSAFELGTKREVLLDEAEEIFIEEMPIAPIFHGSSIRMIQPYIKGIYTSSIGSVHLEKIYFDEEKLEEKLKIY
jgi:oligopeptide transport system substrate-binding protein